MSSPENHTGGLAGTRSGQFLHGPDIRDVAAAAGVSTATVSRALRGLPRVSEPTRRKILAAAAELGYVASSAASELARGRGSQRTAPAGQLKQAGTPAVSPSTSSWVRPGGTRTQLGSPSRGAILVLNGRSTPSSDEEWAHIEDILHTEAAEHGLMAWMTSCTDAEMPGMIRAVAGRAVGIVIDTGNPTCTMQDLHDALTIARIPTVQVRLGNTPCTQNLPNSGACLFSACSVAISGAGVLGYQLAIRYLAQTVT